MSSVSPIESIIIEKLNQQIKPVLLQVVNESHSHNVPPNSETHFKVTVVSDLFDKKRAVARHQMVYGILSEELAGPVHALALHTYTPVEWEKVGQAPESPECRGGSKS